MKMNSSNDDSASPASTQSLSASASASESESVRHPHAQYTQPIQEEPQSLSHLSTSILASKLQNLQSISSTLTSTLTSKLASSQSLLHIGPSLSTLPPDLKTVVDVLTPMVEETRQWNAKLGEERVRIKGVVDLVEAERRRGVESMEGCVLLEDLVAVEALLFGGTEGGDDRDRTSANGDHTGVGEGKEHYGDVDDDDDDDDELDYAASLERAAHSCLHLLQHLHDASAQVTTNTTTTNNTRTALAKRALEKTSTAQTYSVEMAQFLLRLAPRIRRLESETVGRVKDRLESVLRGRMDRRREQLRLRRLQSSPRRSGATDATPGADADADVPHLQQRQQQHDSPTDYDGNSTIDERELLKIGHYLRSLTLLSKITDAESIFATTSVMPLVRRNLSIGRLDEGGNRGECRGLGTWLEEVVVDVGGEWGDVLRLGEGMFGDMGGGEEGERMDLVCGGVWVPIATALMTDPVVRMAIFSPGIAGVLQANYVALDAFLSKLASNLLRLPSTSTHSTTTDNGDNLLVQEDGITINSMNDNNNDDTNAPNTNLLSHYYYQPNITNQTISLAQSRLYHHRTTVDFFKRWNLPIYYQLRFGEACSRLDKVIESTRISGWWYTDEATSDGAPKTTTVVGGETDSCGVLELAVFSELNSILDWLWQDDVFLRPLTHRFLRGAIQLLGRVVGFVREGLEGGIEFGGGSLVISAAPVSPSGNGSAVKQAAEGVDTLYRWVDRIEDVAAVSWELSVLQSYVAGDYISSVCQKVALPPPSNNDSEGVPNKEEEEELNSLVRQILSDTCADLSPLIDRMWNELIVSILTARCTAPLSAVKGVAATYRMTNRPPPTQASPFVHTILRPIREFISTFAAGKTPAQVGSGWKVNIVSTVAEGYGVAVAELIETVQRTEEALKNRKARGNRMASGGGGKMMSDGEKVKLQLYLDREEFVRCVEEVGVDSELVEGVRELRRLTDSAEDLYRKTAKP